MSDKEPRIVPPYIPWKTFTGYIEYLSKTKVVPPRIDTSMMPTSMSGQARSQLKSALRFLGLINAQSIVAPLFVKLIAAYGTDQWSLVLQNIVAATYSPIVQGVDISSGTAGQLNEAFTKAGTDGEVRFKAVRFFLALLKAADMGFSPHFVTRGVKTLGRKNARRKNGRRASEAQDTADIGDEEEIEPASGMMRWPIPIPGKAGAVILVPENIHADDWEMINTVVRAYIARATKAAQP